VSTGSIDSYGYRELRDRAVRQRFVRGAPVSNCFIAMGTRTSAVLFSDDPLLKNTARNRGLCVPQGRKSHLIIYFKWPRLQPEDSVPLGATLGSVTKLRIRGELGHENPFNKQRQAWFILRSEGFDLTDSTRRSMYVTNQRAGFTR
jgi:hypothetical protein